jgi:hypothetical protein
MEGDVTILDARTRDSPNPRSDDDDNGLYLLGYNAV